MRDIHRLLSSDTVWTGYYFFSSWLIFDLFELELIISRLWFNFISDIRLCQRLDSRQLTQIRAPEAREKSSAKREHERRRRESPPEAKGERSEPFAGGARDSAKRNRVFVIMAKFLSPSSHVTCQNWIRPFTKKHRFIAQIDSARSNIASTAWRPCGLSPGIGYRVPENVL